MRREVRQPRHRGADHRVDLRRVRGLRVGLVPGEQHPEPRRRRLRHGGRARRRQPLPGEELAAAGRDRRDARGGHRLRLPLRPGGAPAGPGRAAPPGGHRDHVLLHVRAVLLHRRRGEDPVRHRRARRPRAVERRLAHRGLQPAHRAGRRARAGLRADHRVGVLAVHQVHARRQGDGGVRGEPARRPDRGHRHPQVPAAHLRRHGGHRGGGRHPRGAARRVRQRRVRRHRAIRGPGRAGARLAARHGLRVGGERMKALRSTGLVLVAGAVVVLVFGQQYAGSVFVLAVCYAIVTAGRAVQLGFSQQIVFSQCVFMGAGAYGVALLTTHFSMPSLLATPVVMVGCGVAALLLGSVVTRASGLALAVATLMLPLIATGYVSSAGYLGGSVGAPLTGNLWNGSSTESVAIGNGLITVAFLAVAVFVAVRILSSDIGLELYALGADERTAAAMGIRTPHRKLELFVLGSVFAAVGGSAYAGTQLFVPATLVDPTAELALLIMLFVGGRRSVLGAVVGAVVIQYLYGASSWVSVNILIIEGILLTVVLLVDPEGLAGILASLLRRLGATDLLPLLTRPIPGLAQRIPAIATHATPATSTHATPTTSTHATPATEIPAA